ncbi:MAG: hypothetical protein H6712_10060 [Myxococcales bacterium]|nr:hypothetical protein [Myxococcales bacterium]MCB9714190.1 hypothetical protein [Myxococcales bacterium]
MSIDPTARPRDSKKRLVASGPPAQVKARYATLHASDKTAELVRKVTLYLAIALGVVSFVGLVGESMWVFGIALAAVVVVVAVRMSFASADIEDRKLEMARTLVETFEPELRPGRPIEVEIDFRGYWRYQPGQAWLSLKMTLANGVVAQVSALDRCKRKSKAKRKYTKIKDKITSSLVVRFTPPKGQRLEGGLQVRGKRMSVGPLTMRSAKITPRAAVFVFSTGTIVRVRDRSGWREGAYVGHMPKGKHAVKALIAAYHLLGRAGAQAAGSRAGAHAGA